MRRRLVLTLCLVLAGSMSALLPCTATGSEGGTAPTVARGSYVNPLRPTTADGRQVQNCADPTVFRGRGSHAAYWYMFCTSDPLNDHDTSGSGAPVFRRLPMMRSKDLVHWTYVGPALPARPSWAGAKAKLWAPDVVYSSHLRRYYLTYAVTDTTTAVSGQPRCTTDAAIAVAVSTAPTGPWRTSGRPLVPPRREGRGCDFESTIDPDVLGQVVGGSDTGVLYFGGFRGGLFAQPIRLTTTGMRTTRARTPVTIGRRYEAANVIRHGGWYYLVASSGQCCNGPVSGYGTFSGRSRSPYGPFTDREGAALRASRTGGTPLIPANGNRWVGPGHTSLFVDRGGQWWAIYHAVAETDPFFATEPGFTRRPPMLDPVDWVGDWPTVRTGRGPSAVRMPVPAAYPHQVTAYRPSAPPADVVDDLLPDLSDEFDGDTLADRWTWTRPVSAEDVELSDGSLRLATQPTQLYQDENTAAVLTEATPDGDYVVETRVHLDVPASGCCYDAVQAGLLIYGSDDSYLKLTHAASGETQQTAFAKETPTAPRGAARFGSTSVGPPGDTTWLRITRRGDVFRADTSRDGVHWVRGAAWRDAALTTGARIGLATMGGAGFTATFDGVRVWSLRG